MRKSSGKLKGLKKKKQLGAEQGLLEKQKEKAIPNRPVDRESYQTLLNRGGARQIWEEKKGGGDECMRGEALSRISV